MRADGWQRIEVTDNVGKRLRRIVVLEAAHGHVGRSPWSPEVGGAVGHGIGGGGETSIHSGQGVRGRGVEEGSDGFARAGRDGGSGGSSVHEEALGHGVLEAGSTGVGREELCCSSGGEGVDGVAPHGLAVKGSVSC